MYWRRRVSKGAPKAAISLEVRYSKSLIAHSSLIILGHHIKQDNPLRDPPKALRYFKSSCENKHAPSCFNVAVMMSKGDKGVPADSEAFSEYRQKTEELVKSFGGQIGGTKIA